MRCINNKDADVVFAEYGLSLSRQTIWSFKAKVKTWFSLPGDSGHKNVIAFELAKYLDSETGSIFAVNETGVWPSCENPHLFEKYREAFGVTYSVDEARYHLLEMGESVVMASLLEMTLFFCWGGTAIRGNGHSGVVITHDEVIGAFGGNEIEVGLFEGVLRDLELAPIL